MASTTQTPHPWSVKRGPVAALASALLPGLGQVYAGRRDIGRRLLIIDAAIFVIFILLLAIFRLEVVKLWVSPTAIAVLMSLNLALLFYRYLATTDAYHSVRDTRTSHSAQILGLVVVGFVLVVPHLVFGYFAVTQYSLIDTVFADSDVVAVEGGGGGGDPEVAPAVVAQDDTGTDGSAEPSPTTTLPGESPLWDGKERLNIVLLGADAGEGRRGLRTDTTIVVSIDPETGDSAMFQVPRDLSGAPLPAGMGIWDCDCFPDLITHLYDAGVNNPEAFPGPQDPPINGIKAAVGEIFGLEIHYYAMVTLTGFVDIVDALGGLTMDIPTTIWDDTYPHEDGSTVSIRIEEGVRHLNGQEALAYARIRRHSDDFNRMNRQRCVLEAITSQTSPAELALRFGSIAEALKRSLDTDIPESLLPDLVDLVPKISTDRISTLRITRDVYKSGSDPGRTYYDTERIKDDAQALLANPDLAQESLGLDSLEGTCSSE